MGENNTYVKLERGTIWISGHPFEGRLETIEPDNDFQESVESIRKAAISTSGLTAAFEAAAEISKAAMIAMLGLENAVRMLCPNRRVLHLATYARKRRIRKKNDRRALKILERGPGR